MDEGENEFYRKYRSAPYEDLLIEIGPIGYVERGFDRKTGQLVAVKFIRKEDENPPDIVENDISTVEKLNDPRITCLLEKIVGKRKTYLVFECLPHNLSTLIQTLGKAPNPPFRKYILGEILRGVEYLHSQNVSHTDLQTEKVLIDLDSKTVKLGYYGLPPRMLTADDSQHFNMPKLWYRAPEFILVGPDQWSCAVDMWSVGCIFAEMVTGKPLFPCDDVCALYLHCLSLLSQPNQEFAANIAPDEDLLMKYIGVRRRSDPNTTDLTKALVGLEPAGVDLLSKMLCLLPEKRITAKDALEHEYFRSD